MSARTVLLLTIGAGPLPDTTPIVPVDTTPTVDGHAAEPLPPPTDMVTAEAFDSVQVAWLANGVAGSTYVVETATDSSGTPGTYSAFAHTPNLHYTVPLQAPRWVRVRAMLNGRTSAATGAVLCEAVSSEELAASAAAIEELETRVTEVEGLQAAQATSITSLTTEISGKNRIYAQASAPTGVTAGDLWIDTDDSNKLYTWTGSAWELRALPTGAKTYYQTTAPASGMVTGDLWFDSDDGNKQYRYNGSAWVAVDDARILSTASALSTLSTRVLNAEEDIDSQASAITSLTSAVAAKNRIFAQSSEPTGVTAGDLWIDTDDSNKLYTWTGAVWTLRALPSGAKTWYQTTPPASGMTTGDLWFDSDDGNKQYRWSGSAWVAVDDARFTSQASAISALDTRVTATETTNTSQATSITNLTTAVGTKTTTFAQNSAPSGTGRVVGDLWIDTDDSNKQYTWDGSAWVARPLPIGAKTYFQTTAPASGMVAGDIWFDSDDNNKQYRYSGSAWVAVDDARIAATASALTTLTTRVTAAEGVNTTQAGQITTLQSDVAGKASASAVSSLTTRVATVEGIYGYNLLPNPALAIDARDWAVYLWNSHSDVNWSHGRDLEGGSYGVTGTHYYELKYTGTPVADKYLAVTGKLFPILPSTAYYFSAGFALTNMAGVDAFLELYDASLGSLTSGGGIGLNLTDPAKTGGTSRANWLFASNTFTTGSTARFAALVFRARTGTGANPRAFLMEPMLERMQVGQVAPTAFNTGNSAAWASWDIRFDVNGYISGMSLSSDGRTTGFEIAADIFAVRAPSGADALTWSAGVLSSRKGSKELKLGPGFGADPSGKRMILSYGAAVADASATRATADVFIAENGDTKFGGFQLNYGSAWKSGAAITYSAAAGTPATATISVTAGVFAIGSREYSYAASSANVTGTNGAVVTYFLYYEDPGLLAGTLTLHASTDPLVTYNNDTRVLVGAVKITFPNSGSGSGGGSTPGGGTGGGGGGGGYCVSAQAWVITRHGPVRAGTIRVGDEMLLCDPITGIECWGVVGYSVARWVDGVRLSAGLASLTCSRTAPIPTDLGYLDAADVLSRRVVTRSGAGLCTAIVDCVVQVGAIEVQHITVGDRCFWASDDGSTFFLHHNLKQMPDL